MKTATANLLLAVLARLPLRANRRLGAVAGWLVWALRLRARRFTELNLTLAFPSMPEAERAALVKHSLIESGSVSTETAWLWKSPARRFEPHLNNPELAGEIARIRGRGRGIIMASPHAGSWELTCLMVANQVGELHYFYRPPRNPAIEPILLEGRTNLRGTALKLDAGGIRKAIRLLRRGEVVGILPDQEPDRNGGVFAPFFGVPALTMTLISRLARAGNADVLFIVAQRTPTGWRDHCFAPADTIGDADPVVAATAANEAVERCVSFAPEQYLWSYRRFRELPQGGRRTY